MSESVKIALNLFSYVQELNKLKREIISNITSYSEYLIYFNELQSDVENISISFRDREQSEPIDTDQTIISVHRPEYEICPSPPKSIEPWLEDGWRSFINDVNRIPFMLSPKQDYENEPQKINFEDNPNRIMDYDKWILQRNKWVDRQKNIEHTISIFQKLYRIHNLLLQDSETYELVVANGFLFNSSKSVNHPVVLKRVTISFDSKDNTIRVSDTSVNSVLYTDILSILNIDTPQKIQKLQNIFDAEDYHPLDRIDTSSFLKSFIHELSDSGFFIKDEKPLKIKTDMLLMDDRNPVLFLRKRPDGTVKAIQFIIDDIKEKDHVPAPIQDLLLPHEEKAIVNSNSCDLTIEKQLSEVGGEDPDILFSKMSNKEQLEIARFIEGQNAVVVQGPPGTGKTHTIANLIGHYLAQGKSILVTSYTSKALSVLKSKIEKEIQPLCVSVLDDSNHDMESSIDGISEICSETNISALTHKIKVKENERKKIINDLANNRKEMFELIHSEYESIVINGNAISPVNAAKYITEHPDYENIIPGILSTPVDFPFTDNEIEDLYESNSILSLNDEREISCDIPEPNLFDSPDSVSELFKNLEFCKNNLQKKAEELSGSFYSKNDESFFSWTWNSCKFEITTSCVPDSELLEQLQSLFSSLESIEEWEKFALIDGKIGNDRPSLWLKLVQQIQDSSNYSHSIYVEQFENDISLGQIDDLLEVENTLNELLSILKRKRKISKLSLLFNQKRKYIYNNLKINSDFISSEDQCNIFLHKIELSRKRCACANLWNKLIAQHKSVSFWDLDDDNQELIAENWIPRIENLIGWFDTSYKNILNILQNLSLDINYVAGINVTDTPSSFVDKILLFANQFIPSFCQVCTIMNKLHFYEMQYLNVLYKIEDWNNNHSQILNEMTEALLDMNINNYLNAFNKLTILSKKKDLFKRRQKLLERIDTIAHEWSDNIRNRIGVSGEKTPPAHLREAWIWKQYNQILAIRNKKIYNELQNENRKLCALLRKSTAEFVVLKSKNFLINKTTQEMQQNLIGWKQTVRKIGKGTGKTAPRLKKEAMKLMEKCQNSVPVWIVPIQKALEIMNPKINHFDIVIIDEASQANISALAILYMGEKLIIVGDDQQVSPIAIGVQDDQLKKLQESYIKDIIPNYHLYDANTSIYDIAKTTFRQLMLKEHFRCVPEIIAFCNFLSYENKIKPLRDGSDSILLPPIVNYRVKGTRDDKRKINETEAWTIVALIKACLTIPEYFGKTFGIISLLGNENEQIKIIQNYLYRFLSPQEINKAKILCGNASSFQGDERDVIFLSLVDSNQAEGPLRKTTFGAGDVNKKRYNVAVSRAKDQLWVVHSLDSSFDLQSGDLRKTLIDFARDSNHFNNKIQDIERESESEFEKSVALKLNERRFKIDQQWQVGAYRIDIVVSYGNEKVAIECDGDRYHSGNDKIREDMERQTILERSGWRFIRIRGSEYYLDKNSVIQSVVDKLADFNIFPQDDNSSVGKVVGSDIYNQVKNQANKFLEEWGFLDIKEDNSINDIDIELSFKELN